RFFFQAEDGIRDFHVTGVQTCALPIFEHALHGMGPFRVVRVAAAPRLEQEDPPNGGRLRQRSRPESRVSRPRRQGTSTAVTGAWPLTAARRSASAGRTATSVTTSLLVTPAPRRPPPPSGSGVGTTTAARARQGSPARGVPSVLAASTGT